jgi:GNAT superfamily N-acetyltransferase
MIFTLWILFIVIEASVHWYIIEVAEVDPTPDGKTSWFHVFVMTARMLVYMILWWTLGIKHNAEFWMFTFGCFFTHLFIFPILLNMMRGLRPHYLGKGFTDKILAYLPFQARVWFLLVLSAGMIYGYYNTNLL